MTPELRVLRALDELRDAMAAVLSTRAEPAEPPATYNLSDAAERLGVSRSTVTRWVDAGSLRTIGTPKARRVPRSEIERLAS